LAPAAGLVKLVKILYFLLLLLQVEVMEVQVAMDHHPRQEDPVVVATVTTI
jgi:hypothetical protein